jgi:tetratricopeptide (TPR) repeat protein
MSRSRLPRAGIDVLINAGLAHLRQSSPGQLSGRHRRLRETLRALILAPAVAAMGDRVKPADRETRAADSFLRWAIVQLRPDGDQSSANISEQAWLHSTSWRPFLALACHHGVLTIPRFRGRYSRSEGESAIENLCGIWAVGPSTVYRYLDKARRQLVDCFDTGQLTGKQRVDLRRATQAYLVASADAAVDSWAGWHKAQASEALVSNRIEDALWHLLRSSDQDGVLTLLKQHASQLASSGETELLLEEFEASGALRPRVQMELGLCRAKLWHFRQHVEREGEELHRTLRLAETHGDSLYTGKTQAALAQFCEERDRDRSIACYEASLPSFRAAIQAEQECGRLVAADEYAQAVVRLAWLHLRRNNPKAKTLLEQLPSMSQGRNLSLETQGALEQTWGEYWRCVGNPRKALEHKHRALTIFERTGDQRSILSTYNNLTLLYADTKDYGRAIDYGHKVISASKQSAMESELLSSVQCNLGVAYFGLGDLTSAIEHYTEALSIDQRDGLSSHAIVSLYNLAEAHFERFKQQGDAADELLGDRYAASAVQLSAAANAPAQAEAARALKREILGTGEGPDRLLPAEHAAHYNEMTEIERLRLGLAVPQPVEQQVRTHLAIARAYLAIAAKERDTAMNLAKSHNLSVQLSGDLDALREAYARELTREQRLGQAWGDRIDELLGKERRQSVLAYVLSQGSINKRAYADVAAVSLATASKHLGLLAERGLLVQTGKGPSTRYLLPDDPGDGVGGRIG